MDGTVIEIVFPEDQQEGTEATIARWLVAEGDSVAAHDPLVEIETDKVVVEVAAPENGIISGIRIPPDEEVNPGDVLCDLVSPAIKTGQNGSDPAPLPTAEPEQAQITSTPPTGLSPAVRQRVMQHKLDITGTTGSGRGGRITLKDVENLIAARQRPVTKQQPAPTGNLVKDSEIKPHDKMRKRIAANMVTSLLHTAPHVTSVFEADMSAVMAHRSIHKDNYAQRGTALTLTVYFVAAAIAAIRKVPVANSCWHEDHLEIFKHINMGIGTALGDEGLIVPVLQDAQDMGLEDIAAGLADLTSRARQSKLTPADVRGGTFTISNHGVSGSLIATPIIINQPQSAILGVGKIEKRIKIKELDGDDVITIRPMCYVSLTIDHRVLDGFQTNAFLTELVHILENWS